MFDIIPWRDRSDRYSPFIKTPFGVTQGQFSPDGRWVAYASNESGKWEIYVAPFPGPGGNWKVSNAGTARPLFQTHRREHIASTDMFSYDIGPDGRFLVNTDVGDATPPSPTIVLNWPAALRH